MNCGSFGGVYRNPFYRVADKACENGASQLAESEAAGVGSQFAPEQGSGASQALGAKDSYCYFGACQHQGPFKIARALELEEYAWYPSRR